MASLNTLRTKFGIVLSIVIAGALLAFILSLKTEMGFSGNDPRVGVIMRAMCPAQILPKLPDGTVKETCCSFLVVADK